jgi:hypothetical protein
MPLLHFQKSALPLHRVFHSIRFKVNKRLGLSGAPFFMLIYSYAKIAKDSCGKMTVYE